AVSDYKNGFPACEKIVVRQHRGWRHILRQASRGQGSQGRISGRFRGRGWLSRRFVRFFNGNGWRCRSCAFGFVGRLLVRGGCCRALGKPRGTEQQQKQQNRFAGHIGTPQASNIVAKQDSFRLATKDDRRRHSRQESEARSRSKKAEGVRYIEVRNGQ